MPLAQSKDKEHPTSSYLENEQRKTDTDTNKLSPMLPPQAFVEKKSSSGKSENIEKIFWPLTTLTTGKKLWRAHRDVRRGPLRVIPH